jgi:hypothetical protein
MPATAEGLSSKAMETAIMVPSGALSRNLKYDSESTNTSNDPVTTILPVSGLLADGVIAKEPERVKRSWCTWFGRTNSVDYVQSPRGSVHRVRMSLSQAGHPGKT